MKYRIIKPAEELNEEEHKALEKIYAGKGWRALIKVIEAHKTSRAQDAMDFLSMRQPDDAMFAEREVVALDNLILGIDQMYTEDKEEEQPKEEPLTLDKLRP